MARLMELAEMVGNANTELKSSSSFTGGVFTSRECSTRNDVDDFV